MDTDAPTNGGTRERVITAASEVFAEKGFRKATVREIVRRAGVNLNAVNYHFGDKQGLYHAVLGAIQQSIEEDEDLGPARDAAREPADRLLAFVRAFLNRALAKRQRPHLARIMAMEMAEPTGALDVVVDRFIRPRFELLSEIIRALIGTGVPQRKVEFCAESIIAQCIHLVHGRPIATRLMPYLSYSPADIDVLADHITQFSLAAMRQLAGERRPS